MKNSIYTETASTAFRTVFPLYARSESGGPMILSGSGFYAGERGLFFTAEHVYPGPGWKLYAGDVSQHGKYNPVEIISRIHKHDLLAGRSCPSDCYVEVAGYRPEPGLSVCCSGYPVYEDSAGNLAETRLFFEYTHVLDRVRLMVAGNRMEGFVTGFSSFKGMSGGPVFDDMGKVCGMNIAAWRRITRTYSGERESIINAFCLDGTIILKVLNNLDRIIQRVS